MPIEISSANGFVNPNQNTSNNNRTQLEREQQARTQQSEPVANEVEAETRSEQDDVRRTQAVQQLEAQNARVRRDDNSDLNFRAQQAVNRFTEVNDQLQRQDVSELLGIDIFA